MARSSRGYVFVTGRGDRTLLTGLMKACSVLCGAGACVTRSCGEIARARREAPVCAPVPVDPPAVAMRRSEASRTLPVPNHGESSRDLAYTSLLEAQGGNRTHDHSLTKGGFYC